MRAHGIDQYDDLAAKLLPCTCGVDDGKGCYDNCPSLFRFAVANELRRTGEGARRWQETAEKWRNLWCAARKELDAAYRALVKGHDENAWVKSTLAKAHKHVEGSNA